jgi:hypothetical protein
VAAEGTNVMKRVGLVTAFVVVAVMCVGPVSNAATPPPAMRLPFAPGLTAITSGPHTWDGTATGPRGAVDFGSPDGSEQLVFAAAGGRAAVYDDLGWSRCYVVVDHGNGWSTAYYHLKNVPADLNGKTIGAGDVVGNMGAIGVDTCGGGTPGYRHVHFVLLQNGTEYPINGLSLGGYTIHEAPGPYCGYWTRNSDGATVASSLTLQAPSATWPEGRCPRMEPGLTNGGTTPPPPSGLSPTPTPAVSGTAAVGQTLTAVPGTWGPAPVTLAYQWYRGAAAITGATTATYPVQAADVGSTLKVAVTGSKAGYPSVTRTSATTAAVAGAALSATPTPTISGTAKVGQTLTAVPGTWGPAPVTLTYRWYRGSTAITGATAATYPVQSADAGSTLRVAVTGSKAGFASVTRTSAATATVVPTTSTPTPPPARAIVGNFEGARVAGSGVEVVGWAIDPDTTAPIYVWVTVDGVGRHLVANVNRPDVGAAYPAFGPRHGFSGVVAAAPGTRRVCVTASNVGPGSHKPLGCRTVTVPLRGVPFGNFEGARVAGSGVEVVGWAIDPDTTAPIYVWLTVDGVGRHLVANVNRPDVGAAHPAFGPRHGFSGVVAAAPGTRRVCVTASNVGPGSHKPLGCRTVTVPAR